MTPSHGDWQVGSVLCHVDFTEQFTTQQLTSLEVNDEGGERRRGHHQDKSPNVF